ncbi:MAG: DEAD/DEAH box helicase family protein, partial [Proteobacteria bacterium]|nr:DEAD/DEAH box helicase family protein [Pseudomonadota bacterium]
MSHQESSFDLSTDLAEPLAGGAHRLAELLSHDELRRLLGPDLYNGFRSLAYSALGRTLTLTKESLSAGLLLVHGADLFRHKPVRDAVAKQLKISSPSRWVSGKAKALLFTHEAGFDKTFAGTPAERAPDDVEWFEGRMALPPLADFQKEVLNWAKQSLKEEFPRAIVSLPTGAGKTRVATEYVTQFLSDSAPPAVVLWVAHTEELLEQAVEALRQVWAEAPNVPALRMDRRFGDHGRGDGADEELLSSQVDPQFLVGTPLRLLNDFKRWQDTLAEAFDSWCDRVRLIVIDEAHRAAAPQYKSLIEFFGQRSKRRAQPEPYILGLTATPFRYEYFRNYPELGTTELYKLFRKFVEPKETLGLHPREA